MSTRTDPRFDAYLEKAPAFAQPILEHVRGLVREACPTAQETLKWRMPSFVYRGKILCIVGAFKAHCRMHFWNSEFVVGQVADKERFTRLTSVDDLPDDRAMRRYLETAVEQIEAGESTPPRSSPRKPELPVPADLAALLKQVPAARKTLDGLPPSCRREYLAWIADAKRPETRARRLATAVEWLAEGKRYDWKSRQK